MANRPCSFNLENKRKGEVTHLTQVLVDRPSNGIIFEGIVGKGDGFDLGVGCLSGREFGGGLRVTDHTDSIQSGSFVFTGQAS